MSKKQKKTNKLTVIIIASLLLIISIGLVAWAFYLHGHNSSTDESTSTADTTSSGTSSSTDSSQAETATTPTVQTDPNEGYVTIDEWGVRFKPVEGLLTAVYFMASNSTDDSYRFSVQEIINAEPNCATDGFLSITRRSEPTDNYYESLLATINGYYYYKEDANSACSNNEANLDLELQQSKLLKESVKSLEAMEKSAN